MTPKLLSLTKACVFLVHFLRVISLDVLVWSQVLKSKACDRRKRAVAPLSCAELAELVTNLVNVLTDGVDKYDKSVGYNWPASTVLRICGFIEESVIDKEDCDDADLTTINDKVKAYQVLPLTI